MGVVNSPVCVCFVCQTRLTADKSMRLLLSTFSSLREELLQMTDDLRVRTVTTRQHKQSCVANTW